MNEKDRFITEALGYLRQISGIDSLRETDFGDHQLIIIDKYSLIWSNGLFGVNLTSDPHGTEIESLVSTTSIYPNNVRFLELADGVTPKNALEGVLYGFRLFNNLFEQMVEYRHELGRVISISTHPLRFTRTQLETEFNRYLDRHEDSQGTIKVWGESVDLAGFLQMYDHYIKQYTQAITKLREFGFIFVVSTTNQTSPDELNENTAFLNQSISVAGITIVHPAVPNAQAISDVFREKNCRPDSTDVRFISSWKQRGLGSFSGNSFATPLVAEGVVMIQHYFPELFEVDETTTQSVKIGLAKLREQIIRIMLSVSSPIRKVDTKGLRVLDLSVLKNIASTRRAEISQLINLMRQKVLTLTQTSEIDLAPISEILRYEQEDNSIGSRNYPIETGEEKNLTSLIDKVVTALGRKQNSTGVFFSWNGEPYFIGHDLQVVPQGENQSTFELIQDRFNKKL